MNIQMDNKTPLMLRIEANALEVLDTSKVWPITTRREHYVAMAEYYERASDSEWNAEWAEFYGLVAKLYIDAIIGLMAYENLSHYLDGLCAYRDRAMRESYPFSTQWSISWQIVDVKTRLAAVAGRWM